MSEVKFKGITVEGGEGTSILRGITTEGEEIDLSIFKGITVEAEFEEKRGVAQIIKKRK